MMAVRICLELVLAACHFISTPAYYKAPVQFQRALPGPSKSLHPIRFPDRESGKASAVAKHGVRAPAARLQGPGRAGPPRQQLPRRRQPGEKTLHDCPPCWLIAAALIQEMDLRFS